MHYFAKRVAVLTVASFLGVARVDAESIQHSNNGSHSLSCNLDTTGVQLIPGVDLIGETGGRAIEYGMLELPGFDRNLGNVTGVNFAFTGTGTTTHSRGGASEMLLCALACTFSIATESSADFGLDIPAFDPGGADASDF